MTTQLTVTVPEARAMATVPRMLVAAMGALLAVDLAGGLWAALSGVNSWSDAWGGQALLAAPLPMIAGQMVMTWWSVRGRSRLAAVPAGLLAVACLVSLASGFFDGGLGHAGLKPGMAAYQVLLLLVTGVVGALAAARAAQLASPLRADALSPPIHRNRPPHTGERAMTQLHTPATGVTTPPRKRRQRWPLLATAAGVTGFMATMVLDGRTVHDEGVSLDHQLFADLDPLTFRLSMVFGYLTVVLLLVLAATWRRRVEPRLPDSTAAHLVPLGLVSSAAGLTYGYGWKGALGNYLPGSFEPTAFDDGGLYIYYVLNDFGAWIGWLGVVIAAGAVAVMGLREGSVSRWIGALAVLPVLQTTFMVAGLGVPGVPALLGPIWLVVTGLGLHFGTSTISR